MASPSQIEKTRQWMLAGLCRRCGKFKAAPGSTRCEPCKEYARLDNAVRYRNRKNQHRCPRCGTPKTKGKICLKCLRTLYPKPRRKQ